MLDNREGVLETDRHRDNLDKQLKVLSLDPLMSKDIQTR